MITALHAGFCTSELLSLTWEDVDFRRQTITVHAAYAKNGESRSVLMNDVLTTTLKAVRMNGLADSLVFCSHKGTPYRSFRSAFELAVRKAGLENFTFHDLRHTFASRLVMAGVDLPTVKELMGHKDITMTLRYTLSPAITSSVLSGHLNGLETKSQQFSQQIVPGMLLCSHK